MSWQHIRLNLARTDEFPNGSAEHGYDLVAPVASDGTLDEMAWRENKSRSYVRRFWKGEADETGELVHNRHRTWAFSYMPGEDDDEPIFSLESHRLAEGEYITITEHDGQRYPFRIVAMAPLVDA